MSIKITTLVENTVPANHAQLRGEHGLSFLIETDHNKILFDTGQGLTILGNADALKIKLGDIDTVVLSHGHFDHTGGLKHLMERNTDFTLIAHPDVFGNKFLKSEGKFLPIGMPIQKKVFEKKGIKLKLEEDSVEIAPGIMTTGKIEMKTDFEDVEAMFFRKDDGYEVPDTIPDDISLILKTPEGRVVIFGCAHRGAANILSQVIRMTGDKKIYAVVGGLHLMRSNEGKRKKLFEYLKRFNIEKLIVGHCTGFHATAALLNTFGSRVTPNTVGHVIEF